MDIASELAKRAGLPAEYTATLIELGVLSGRAGNEAGDVRRARIMHGLEEAGLNREALVKALRRGDLSLDFADQPIYERFAELSDVTFRQASERSGVPLELLVAIREAMGSAEPGPDDCLRQNELDVIPMLELELRQGVAPRTIERVLRATGENLRRIAEVEADWWHHEVIGPIFAAGGSPADVGRITGPFAAAIGPLTDTALLAMYHGQQSHAWLRNIFEGFEAALTRAGLQDRAARPPAICFLDLTGYTRLTEERGDAAAADLAGRLSRIVQRTSSQHGGKPIKWLGDGVMFHFREAGPGVVAALEMVEEARDANLPPAHVGLHAGPVLFQEGDYFGRTVNIAARIADYARQGEVLVTDEVVAAAEALEAIRFDPIGPVELKGLTEAVSLHAARRST